jgi:hypothetical protein
MLRICRNDPGTVTVEGSCLRQELDSGSPSSPKEGSLWMMFPFIGCNPKPPQANIRRAYKTPDAPSVVDVSPSDKLGWEFELQGAQLDFISGVLVYRGCALGN